MSPSAEEPICAFCEDAAAVWVVDKETRFGGSGDPEWDAPVYQIACDACKCSEGSSYMEPEPLTPAWRRYFEAPWSFYEAPHAGG